MQKILTAIETVKTLRERKDALQAMLDAVKAGKAAWLFVDDCPGRVPMTATMAVDVIRAQLQAINAELLSLHAKLEAFAESL